jgi:secreted trypsin-like serine protease
MPRALLVAVLILAALAPSAPAASPQPRIVNGTPADPGEYSAQGFLLIDLGGGDFGACGGTVVSARKFLTAGHCVADDSGRPRPPEAFDVFLGQNNVSDFTSANDHLVSAVELHPDYAEDRGGHTNDVAVLTFSAPVAFTVSHIIRPTQRALWVPGATARIIGWGTTSEGASTGSDALLEADVPIRTDAVCAGAYGDLFVASTMVCAGAANPPSSTDTCQGDSGGPLLVQDGAFRVVTGVVSFGNGCNQAGFPGIYSRVGDQPLNAWVRGRVSTVDFAITTPSARAGEPVSFSATSPASGNFVWDFDNDGSFEAAGPSATHVYPQGGEFEAVLRITDDEGQFAEQRRELTVAPPPPPPPLPPPPPPPPPVASPTVRLATILVFGKPKVRRGRFRIRLNFAASAPSGIAVIEVFRGKRKIGGARARVRRGGSRQVVVTLTKTGRRLLRRSDKKRLKVRVQVRVKRQVLRSKTVTIRQ